MEHEPEPRERPMTDDPRSGRPATPPPYDRFDRPSTGSPRPSDGPGGGESPAPRPRWTRRGRSRPVAVALALFLGGMGVHKFYLGRIWQGLLYVLFFWTAIPAIVSWIEAVLLLNMEDATFARRYGGSGAPADRVAIGCLWVLALAPIVATALYLMLGGEPGGLLPNPFIT